ncbi:MAG: helix-turn-helix domain-containing protein [Candidatus Methanofastidiosia archaeon]|jgi:predicted DNA binding protein
MRKVIITTEPDFLSQFRPQNLFKSLEYIEGKALLRLDFEKGVKLSICDIKVKNGVTLEDVALPDGWNILNVLKKTNNTYTCLVKVEYRSIAHILQSNRGVNIKKNLQLFGGDIIFDLPYILSKEKFVFAFIADNKKIKKFLDHINMLGNIKSISFQPATFADNNILSCLTDRQKEVITTAKKSGYYDLPRKISTEELSKNLGISRATTIEHLRKAENRIISCVLAGY